MGVIAPYDGGVETLKNPLFSEPDLPISPFCVRKNANDVNLQFGCVYVRLFPLHDIFI